MLSPLSLTPACSISKRRKPHLTIILHSQNLLLPALGAARTHTKASEGRDNTKITRTLGSSLGLEIGCGEYKPFHAGTPVLLPGVCGENSQDKRSAAIIRVNKNVDKMLQTHTQKKKKKGLSEQEPNLCRNSLITIFQPFPSRKSTEQPLSYVFLK